MRDFIPPKLTARIALSTDSKNRSLQSFMGSLCGQTTHNTLACNCNNRIVDLQKQKRALPLKGHFENEKKNWHFEKGHCPCPHFNPMMHRE